MVLSMQPASLAAEGTAPTEKGAQSQELYTESRDGKTSDSGASDFAGGSGTANDPYQISSDTQLVAISKYLDAHYKLTQDIDLSGYENWQPIGAIRYGTDVNMETGEMDYEKMFSGTFDGNGKTISNVTVDAGADADMMSPGGIFSCVYKGEIKDLTVKNVTVTANAEASMTSGGVVGYAIDATLDNVTVTADEDGRNTITGRNCIGGVAGGSENSALKNCAVSRTDIVVLGDNDFSATPGRIIQCDVAECGGSVVGGGFGGSIEDSKAEDCAITAAGNEPVGLGGLAGSMQCMNLVSGNTVTNVTIKTEKGGHAIGGLGGYAGTGDDGAGVDAPADAIAAPAAISDNTVTGVVINAPGATHVGGMIGTGLYFFGMEDRFDLTNCTVSDTSITAGTDADSVYGATTPGAVAGRAVGSKVEGCAISNVTINSVVAAESDRVGVTNGMYESADHYADSNPDLLPGLTETYQPLFEGATFEEKYSHYWHDYCAAIVGASLADETVAGMKHSIGGSLYGQAAEDAYTADPESTQFFCGFTEGLDQIRFNGGQITGYQNGAEVFSHAYRYIGTDALYMNGTAVMPGFNIYESLDGNEDAYQYFFMAPDTPGETYHIEFRYGGDLDELKQYGTGSYAYWLAAGIPTGALSDPDETLLEQGIALFCLENMDYTGARTQDSLSQLSDVVGTWDCDVSDYPEFSDLGVTSLYCVLQADGTGTTYANGAVSSSYKIYAYDNSTDGRSGIYVAYNEDEGANGSHYALSGNTITFTTLEGESITYTARGTSSGGSGGSSSSSYTVAVPSSTANGSVSTSPRNAAKGGKVTLTVKPDAGYELDTLTVTDASGNKMELTKVSDTQYTFTMPASKVSVQAAFRAVSASGVSGFGDVSASDYFADAVAWAVDQGITTGTGANTFSPAATCTRGQIVTFLWRAKGSPAPSFSSNAAADIAADAYYYKAVLWAMEQGITTGTSATTFSPDQACTRAQIVTFLWRANGGADTTAAAGSFTDVPADAYYADAVGWAVEQGITTGTSAGAFSPSDICTRAQCVTFLYRDVAA